MNEKKIEEKKRVKNSKLYMNERSQIGVKFPLNAENSRRNHLFRKGAVFLKLLDYFRHLRERR